MKFKFYIIFFIPHLLLALDPGKNLTDYLVRQWTVNSGLPINTINSLVQTKDGYIWIGTPAGLIRFDGVQFKTFTRWNTPILVNDKIRCLHEDEKETLWIGTDGAGLFSYKQGLWKTYNKTTGLSNNHITSITSDLTDNLWIGTEYGLNRINSNGAKTFTTRDGLYDNIISSLVIDPWGNVWVGTLRGGLAQWIEGIFRVYDYNDGLKNMSVRALYSDQMGNTWIGTLEGLHFLKQGENVVQNIPGTSYTPVTSIAKGPNSSLWIGTMADGLKRLMQEKMDSYSSDQDFPDDYIRCILTDEDGNIWIGTEMAGLLQLKDRLVHNITQENGLPEQTVTAVLQDRKGTFWIGTRNTGLYKMINNNVSQYFFKNSELSKARIKVLHEDTKGNLWIGTETKGLVIISGDKIIQLSKKDGLTSNHITSIIEEKSGTTWIATDQGLNRYSNGIIENFASLNELSSMNVRALCQIKQGEIYVGAKNGLFLLSTISSITLKKLNQNNEFDVSSLYADGSGVLWIGTNGNGLFQFYQGGLKSCTTKQGLIDNHIFSITEDAYGYLWISSYKGVFKINSNDLNNFFENKINYITPVCYDENEGMKSRQCIGGIQPSVCKTKSGSLYYPTAKGISIFNPSRINEELKAPEIIIEDILADNNPIEQGKEILLSPGTDRIEFIFTALDFTAPEKIHFKYKLDGLEKDFNYLKQQARRIAVYSNLDAGEYSFILNAKNNNGKWNEQPLQIVFEILPSFYSRPVFYMFLCIGLLIISSTLIVLRKKKKEKKQRNKYKTSTLDPDVAKVTLPKLLQLVETEKLYLDPDLTLKDLSQKLGIHYNHLSRIINEQFGLSYNDFINKYRIEEAKNRISPPKCKDQNISQIMYDTGFYSKSVFNSAFKKFTGLTPSEYRKRNL